jgi:hypothetical protein
MKMSKPVMPTAISHPSIGYRGMISSTVNNKMTATMIVVRIIVGYPSLCIFISDFEATKLGNMAHRAKERKRPQSYIFNLKDYLLFYLALREFSFASYHPLFLLDLFHEPFGNSFAKNA